MTSDHERPTTPHLSRRPRRLQAAILEAAGEGDVERLRGLGLPGGLARDQAEVLFGPFGDAVTVEHLCPA